MPFPTALAQHFPGALPMPHYVAALSTALGDLGFDSENTLACVGTCRDELCQPLHGAIELAWGEAFNFSGLGGLLSLGRTGFDAALNHSPLDGRHARMLYLVMPHVAVDHLGIIGHCDRPGRTAVSTACGALMAFQEELRENRLSLTVDPLDLEQSILKQRLLERLAHNHLPSLVEITRAAYDISRLDLRRMIEHTVDPTRTDWAVLTGIQIHGPDAEWIWPGESYVVVDGRESPLTLV
jgi:hypothetical protein